MRLKILLFVLIAVSNEFQVRSQEPQGFFLGDWRPVSITSPEFIDVPQTESIVTTAVTVDLADTLTRISKYLFGDNANLWTGTMANNSILMKNIRNRDIGVLRGPGGSISDVFFWNRNADQRPSDIPPTLVGSSEPNYPWYGVRPHSWESWTMATDSLYSILKKVNATGMITVNYGYARYGTGEDPVANAAHMAADWVRYDKGRTKFWEIGNENFGSWEAGYRIDRSLNRDGQPELISPSLYGQHCRIFIDSMRAAAETTGFGIRIGVVMAEASTTSPGWNQAVAAQVGDMADFYVIHSYYTPYNENSTAETILNSYARTGSYLSYVKAETEKAGKPPLPVALTEYNTFATGSGQSVSHVGGMHAVLVTGEAIKTGLGAACRWDLANGYDNGNDHGMFAFNEPGIPDYTPHPAFYHLYYLRRFTGDVLLNSTAVGGEGIVVIPSAFASGHIGAAIVNTGRQDKTTRLNIANFRFGDRYYTFTLTGSPGEDFSRKVYVNGASTTLDAGGPMNYESLKPKSSVIDDEIAIKTPALSVTFVLVEPGTRELVINNEVGIADTSGPEEVIIFPNPADSNFTIKNIPLRIHTLEIKDLSGRQVFKYNQVKPPEQSFRVRLDPGVYLIILTGDNRHMTRKLVIR